MGIVSSTFLSLAVQFAWNFQRYLDPRYSKYIEPKTYPEAPPEPLEVQPEGPIITELSNPGTEEYISTHQENKRRRAAQRRFRRKRPSSFDASLIVKNVKTGVIATRVVSSTPSTLTRQQAPPWHDSSASSSSSSEELEVRPEKNESLEKCCLDAEESKDKEVSEVYAMSAAEEAAFRMTVGRGHFSRSKKDKFLNHLRLEKRLNGLNREFFEFACREHSRTRDITPVI